jgi:hypothetical protein
MYSQQMAARAAHSGATMNTHFQATNAARAIDGAPRNSLVRKAKNSNLDRSDHGSGQSPFSPLLCVLLLVCAGLLVKFGPALQSFHLAH